MKSFENKTRDEQIDMVKDHRRLQIKVWKEAKTTIKHLKSQEIAMVESLTDTRQLNIFDEMKAIQDEEFPLGIWA